ncbi:MAG: prolipoprotein diacylglyceryl transferase [Clostridiales bacterium]|nr:prolipoprotein diacylglyceryl transferase [Clostridiales bacterium]
METISFPRLGWTFHVNPELFHFSLFGVDFSIRWYGLIIAAGFLLAMVYAFRRAKTFRLDADRMIDVVLVSALFAFIGARLYYVVFYGGFDWSKPGEIFAIWDGGLAIYGGVIFAFLTALWMCRLRKVDTLRMFDLASLGFLIGQGIGRWGNFFNQEAFGGNTAMPWGMTGSIIQSGATGNTNLFDPSLPVHPTFLYESLWCLLGFALLHLLSRRFYRFKGEIFALYIMWYGTGRFFIEGLRTDSLYFGVTGIRISQVVALLSVLGGLVLLFILRAYSRRLPDELPAFEDRLAELESEAGGESADSSGDAEAASDAEETAVNRAEVSTEETGESTEAHP